MNIKLSYLVKTASIMVLVLALLMPVGADAAILGGANVNCDTLYLRDGTSSEAPAMAIAHSGAAVILLEETDDSLWYRVWFEGVVGYVYAEYLDVSQATDMELGVGVIEGTSVRMRSGAGTDSDIMSYHNDGESMEIAGVYGEWYKVRLNGLEGFVHSEYLVADILHVEPIDTAFDGTQDAGSDASGDTPEDVNATPEDVSAVPEDASAASEDVNAASEDVSASGDTQTPENVDGTIVSAEQLLVDTAMQYLGVPYVWAGTSPKGFDCSGFVYYVYQQNGYATNRTAELLMLNGEAVDKNDLQPGDVIGFANGGYVFHCGIYIGDGQFIHASSGTGDVTVTDLSTSYYASRYYGARRIV